MDKTMPKPNRKNLTSVSLPNQSIQLEGFWAPNEEGDEIYGVFRKYIENFDPPFFAFELLEETNIKCRVTDDDSEDGWKKNSNGEFLTEMALLPVGSIVGVGRSNNLEGLEKYLGHEILITYQEKVKTKAKRYVKKYDVKVSKRPYSDFETAEKADTTSS